MTDEETDLKNKETTTLVLDQNSSGVKLRYMVSLYINMEAQTIPNKCTAMHCNALQDAVPMHDAMIMSFGTGTAGPLMGTMHSPQVRSEMKDKRNKSIDQK